jgi:uncharacterized membrane protein (DUF106 family)
MQLLFEEFLKKVYGVSKGNTNSLMLIIVIRFMVYGFILGALALVIYLIYSGRYTILFILIGLIILGEAAHFIRKSLEKSAHNKAPRDAHREHAAHMLKTEKSKNDKLLKSSKPKNKAMLKASRPKNKSLLTKNKKLLSKQ